MVPGDIEKTNALKRLNDEYRRITNVMSSLEERYREEDVEPYSKLALQAADILEEIYQREGKLDSETSNDINRGRQKLRKLLQEIESKRAETKMAEKTNRGSEIASLSAELNEAADRSSAREGQLEKDTSQGAAIEEQSKEKPKGPSPD